MSNSELEKDKRNIIENETNSSETTKGSKVSNEVREEHERDESDEDVPGDFFDDFLKEDFMAGLDIVDDDEWDDEKIKLGNESVENSTKDVSISATKKSQIEISKKRKKLEKDGTKFPLEQKPRSKQKKKKNEEQDFNRKHKRNIDADEFDIRRDPEKTKRDIARDKVRCEKDKEMKIISEKLNLVETGLVPPGMEMEIDIEEIKKQKEKIDIKVPRDLREHIKDLKGRNKTPTQSVTSPPQVRGELERSPLRRRKSPLTARRRSRSPRRDSVTLRRASPRRSPFRRISPRRSPHRISPRHRSSERLYGRRRSRSPSPFYRKRRNKLSPFRHRNRSGSRESEREKWLKHRHKSRSPRRKRDEKKSFLQEIAEKLNEIRQPVNIMPPLQHMQPMLQPMQPTLTYVQPQPLPVPAPAPVPPPNNGHLFSDPSQQQFDLYDQNFFIGNSQAHSFNDFSSQAQPSPLPGLQLPSNPYQPSSSSNIISNSLTPNAMNSADLANFAMSKNQTKQLPQTQEDVTKLFQDKQITLSEFLAITAKPEVLSASPTHLQEKIKVITRCHEAMKILASGENKYSGKLVVRKTSKFKPVTGKQISPLKSAPPVLFPFTNPLEPFEQEKYSFTNFINELLQKLGLLKETVVDVDEFPSEVAIVDKIETAKAPPPPPPLFKPFNKFAPEINQIRYNNFQDNRLCKMVQTDVFKCESCEKRKKILYRPMAMQTIEPAITFSVSTQVTEEDLNPKIPKTQSLAALTPAQLLAKSRESLNAATRSSRIDADSFDIHQTNYNRPIYGLPRSNLPPFPKPMSLYDTLSSHMSGVGSHMSGVGSHMSGGGGGRVREPFGPRMKDSNIRFTYNNYY